MNPICKSDLLVAKALLLLSLLMRALKKNVMKSKSSDTSGQNNRIGSSRRGLD